MTTLLNAATDITIIKDGTRYNRDNLPVFFNSISSVKVDVKTGEIVVLDITLTPNFNDAMDILRSGLLGINMGSNNKETKPEAQGKIISPVNVPMAPSSAGIPKVMSGFAQVEIQLKRPGETMGGGTNKYETQTYSGALTQPDISIQGAEIAITMRGYANLVFATGSQLILNCDGEKTLEDVLSECLELIGYEWIEKEKHESNIAKKLSLKIEKQKKQDTIFGLIKWALNYKRLGFVEGLTKTKGEKPFIVIYDMDMVNFKPGNEKYTFVQWRQLDFDNNIFPLISFNVDSAKSLFLTGRSFGGNTKGANEKLKSMVTNETSALPPDSQAELITQNSGAIDETATAKTNGLIALVPTQESTESSQQIQNEKVLGSSTYQKFSMEVHGIPDIAPLDQIKLAIGDIQAFTGVIIITRVNHTIDNNGWITSLEGTKMGDIDQSLAKEIELPASSPEQASATPSFGSSLVASIIGKV